MIKDDIMALLTNHIDEFITVLTITVVIIITPGPDFFIVVKNSLSGSTKTGIFTSLGIASGVWLHISYSLLGIAFIISKNLVLFKIIKLLGICYLFYIGFSCLKNSQMEQHVINNDQPKKSTNIRSFYRGFVNNSLNPKATLFFLSLFTQVVDQNTPLIIKIFYGMTVSFVCFIWFSTVSILLNNRHLKRYFLSSQSITEKIMGLVLIIYSIKMIFT